ncbi:MAG: hypothetical protein M1826_003222 [Phylliscum demangeonii]|nr:MAG: hypothetical protein M1826_003222 [Phylliscum demangeonii]
MAANNIGMTRPAHDLLTPKAPHARRPSSSPSSSTSLTFIPDPSTSPTPTLQTIIDRLSKWYRSPAAGLGRWSVECRVWRETGTGTGTGTGAAWSGSGSGSSSGSGGGGGGGGDEPARMMQLLTLSHHAGTSYVCIARAGARSSTRPEAGAAAGDGNAPLPTMVAIPHPAASEPFTTLLRTRLAPLWTSRQTVVVSHGVVFELDDFTVRVGDVRAAPTAGAGIAALPARGVLVETEWRGGGGRRGRMDGDGEGEREREVDADGVDGHDNDDDDDDGMGDGAEKDEDEEGEAKDADNNNNNNNSSIHAGTPSGTSTSDGAMRRNAGLKQSEKKKEKEKEKEDDGLRLLRERVLGGLLATTGAATTVTVTVTTSVAPASLKIASVYCELLRLGA